MITKEFILEEVAKMFRTNGIKPVTMDYISMDLKISKRTLYEIFDDKEDLVKQVLAFVSDKLNAERDNIIHNSENVIEAIFEIAKQKLRRETVDKISPKVFEDLKKYHPTIYSEAVQKFSQQAYDLVFKIIEQGKQENYFKQEVDTEIIIYILQKINKISETEKESALLKSKTPRNFHETIVLPYLRGIATPEGQALIENYIKKLFK